ncbi:hypothetical protein AF72_05070 [Xylella taiwanensis]|uniref:Uncharacterized protein n=1 Tax=Xylella taiwanensis TaxID=1444770 RepID=Z9JJR3_9GAMM|nr:hypothetical protein AF72_05070 [Xylella taiwanensis]
MDTRLRKVKRTDKDIVEARGGSGARVFNICKRHQALTV